MKRLSLSIIVIMTACFFISNPVWAGAKDSMQIKPKMVKQPANTIKAMPPDLVISNINYSPGKPVSGDEITLWVFVKNIGKGKADASALAVKIGGETNPQMVQIRSLAPGKQYRFTKKFTLDRPGRFIVRATADANNGLAESNERNNEKTATIKVQAAGKADLIISKINFSPGKPTVNDEITFWVFVKNIGNGSSTPSKLSFRIGGESNPAIASVPALPPGKEYRFTRKATLSKVNNYIVKAIADAEKTVNESKETNNEKEKTVSVTKPAQTHSEGVHIQSVTWSRSTKKWVATIKNSGSTTVTVSIAGFPLENGAPGMTFWANNQHIGANQEYQLTGDYSNFNVPSGTRLKVHVILKPSDTKVDEKVIVLD